MQIKKDEIYKFCLGMLFFEVVVILDYYLKVAVPLAFACYYIFTEVIDRWIP